MKKVIKKSRKLKPGECINPQDAAPDVPRSEGKRHPLSDFPERKMLEGYFGHIGTVLPENAQTACLEKCDPEHPNHDAIFADISIRSASALLDSESDCP